MSLDTWEVVYAELKATREECGRLRALLYDVLQDPDKALTREWQRDVKDALLAPRVKP